MNPVRILVAGIGNIFLGDDAFGVEVAQRLMRRTHAPDVRVADFGIRGIDLAYALLDGCDIAILIDAVPRGDGPPGTLYLLEPELDSLESAPAMIEAHSMDPVKVLITATAMGAKLGKIFIVGCQPAPADDDECVESVEMSPAVRAAIEPAVEMVESLLEKLRGGATVKPQTSRPTEVSPCPQ